VHWDEQVIEEHNKERGTRQKIDEPDTPYVRSPQTASDSEGGPASSDDEHRTGPRGPHHPSASASSGAGSGPAGPSSGGGAPPVVPDQGLGDVDPLALASRLDSWVKSGGNQRRSSAASSSVASSDGNEYAADVEYSRLSSGCSSRSSSSAPPGRHPPDATADGAAPRTAERHRAREERRISMSADALQPKPTSDFFKAKRAQHYNEVAAMKAFKSTGPRAGGDSSPESETSDEAQTKTNTNTNINQTVWKTVDRAWPRLSGDAEGGSCTEPSRAQPPGDAEPGDAEPGDAEPGAPAEHHRAVSFSGESGGESSEEFRSLRHSHYVQEWQRDPTVPTTISSLETNTNTNLNAGSSSGACRNEKAAWARNPMEAARPPVKFGDDTSDAASSTEEFRAKRQGHYDEVNALRRFRAETPEEEANEEAESYEAGQVDADAAGPDAEQQAPVANPANPMEPREPGVAFQVGGTEGSEDSPDAKVATGAETEVWRARRQAHYNEMAAALRSMPPPSDEEEDEEEEHGTA